MDPGNELSISDGILSKGVYRNDGYTILFQLIVITFLGIILSSFSFGLLFLLIYALGQELIYGAQINYRYSTKIIVFRFSIFAAGFLAWYVGRLIHGDENPLRGSFKVKSTRYKLCKFCDEEKRKMLEEDMKKLIEERT